MEYTAIFIFGAMVLGILYISLDNYISDFMCKIFGHQWDEGGYEQPGNTLTFQCYRCGEIKFESDNA